MVYLFVLLIRLYVWAVIWCVVIVGYLMWAMIYAVVFLATAVYVAIARSGSPRRLSPPPVPRSRPSAGSRRSAATPTSSAGVPPPISPAQPDLAQPPRSTSEDGRTLRGALVRHEEAENSEGESVRPHSGAQARLPAGHTLVRTARLRREELKPRDGE